VLLEVGRAPTVFASSPRVRAQHACLTHARSEPPGPDLAQLYACPPIPVGRPMSGCALVTEPASKPFPGPEDDSWYAKLVGIPWSRRLDGASASLEVKPAIPVNLYVEPGRVPQELFCRLIVTTPVDAHAEAMHIGWCAEPPNEVLQRHPLAARPAEAGESRHSSHVDLAHCAYRPRAGPSGHRLRRQWISCPPALRR
jgi:hypothetical protein